MANAEIEFRIEEALGGIVVSINDDGAEMQVVSSLGDVALGGDGEEWEDCAEGDAEQKESHASQHSDSSLSFDRYFGGYPQRLKP